MEKNRTYTEDELVHMYQDGEITLAELVVFHPSEWGEEFGLFLARHPERNVRIVTHEVNTGLPAARNTGLAAASGEFVYHCDSDDWVETDLLEKMYAAAVGDGADYVYCDFWMQFEKSARYMVNPTYTDPDQMIRSLAEEAVGSTPAGMYYFSEQGGGF